MKLDEALELLGSYGRYQVIVYLTISLFDNFPSIWHMNVMTFLAYEPKHHCKISDDAWVNLSIPLVVNEDGIQRRDKCHYYPYRNGTYSNQSEACSEGWTFDPVPIQTSIVTEWNLVCDRNVLPETAIMVFNVGVMFGAMLFGFLSDKFGRKKSFIFALVLQSIVSSLTAATTNFYLFTALLFVVGTFEQGVNIIGFIMATELFPPKQRTIFGVSHEFFWAVGGAILPVFAYFLRQWRHLLLAISLPSIVGIIFWWVIPESAVWLIAKGRIKEAEAILAKAAYYNKKSLPPNCLSDQVGGTEEPASNDTNDNHSPTTDSIDDTFTLRSDQASDVPIKPYVYGLTNREQNRKKQRTYTVLDLFRTPKIRKVTICICILWAVNTMVYFGLSYNTPNLEGDMYVNFFVGQMVEIPSVAVTLFLIYKLGRRWPLCLFHVFGGLVCIASPFIPEQTASGFDLKWLSVTLAMLGKFAINASFTIIYIYGPEIYPTVVRSTGAGLASFSGRFGGILFPYINYMSKLDTPLRRQLPLMVFGILSVVGGFTALPLLETRHRPLPETIEDLENYEEFCEEHSRREIRKKNDETAKKKRKRSDSCEEKEVRMSKGHENSEMSAININANNV